MLLKFIYDDLATQIKSKCPCPMQLRERDEWKIEKKIKPQDFMMMI